MRTALEYYQDIVDVLSQLASAEGDLRFYPVGTSIDRPGLVVAPPTYTYSNYGNSGGISTASDLTYTVFLVVPDTPPETIAQRLMSKVDIVQQALELDLTDASVSSVTLQSFGTQGLPCYAFTVEVNPT